LGDAVDVIVGVGEGEVKLAASEARKSWLKTRQLGLICRSPWVAVLHLNSISDDGETFGQHGRAACRRAFHESRQANVQDAARTYQQ
jgi:hypothetical protein